ncbi:hypothetical protein [Desulfurobacterium sp.]
MKNTVKENEILKLLKNRTAENLLFVGRFYYFHKNYEKAIEYLKESVKVCLKNGEELKRGETLFYAVRELAFAYLKMDMYEESLKLFKAVYLCNPEDKAVRKIVTKIESLLQEEK